MGNDLNPDKQRRWLPYTIAIIGIFSSFFLWYFIKEDLRLELLHPSPVETYHPWLALTLGITISLLIATIIRITQLANERARSLNQMNEELKREISERVSAEETKQKLEIALLQGQKLQAIGTLAGGIAHDFNNILYAIIGFTQITRDDVAKDSLPYKNLGKVLEAATRGQELVARILAFSRRQQQKFDVIPMRSTIDAALSLLRPTIPASVLIRFDSENDAVILGNQTQLHQVLVNLITNAVDAMEGEGTIDITLSHVQPHDPLLYEFPESRAQHYCKIEITDTGHGMDQQTMERIFEPFYTTKEVGKGTGLGLSIVHSIIKEHEGEIAVRSKLGQGTTFIILLPENVL